MRYLLYDVFFETVKKTPQSTAIIMENGKNVTYKQLNILSNRFANFILSLKKDIKLFPFVGIMSPVHIESIAAVLGTLKGGCAYVPLDECSPTERLQKIVENTRLDTICVDSRLYEKHFQLFSHKRIKHVLLLNHNGLIIKNKKNILFKKIKETSSQEPPILNQVSDDLAYILHSSGSTGVPKGIMLTHRNARTFVDWMHKEFQVTQKDIIASRAPFKFDLSVFDIFNTFKAGATLVCFDWYKKRPPEEKHSDYVKLMEEENVTILYTTPSTFISLLNRGKLGQRKVALRTIMYAGEPFPPAQLRKLMKVLPQTKVANIYGPSETNIITYYWVHKPPKTNHAIPLGYVVEDTEIIIVSEDQDHICQPNELGELWCRGGTVTLGYLGMSIKTRECLIRSPFHRYPVYFWRTGDFGFYDQNNILHYRGRRDHMVKVKGYRIELGEIEMALSQHPDLDEFVIVAVPDDKYTNRLYCHFSLLKNKRLSGSALKDFLMTKIPEYMLPYRFQKWDMLPKTSSGKIDRVFLAKLSEHKHLS